MFGRFTYTLSALDGHCLFWFFGSVGFLAMFVHIRQRVREQPDTGYRKWLTAYFAAALAVGGFWGSGLDLAAFGVVWGEGYSPAKKC